MVFAFAGQQQSFLALKSMGLAFKCLMTNHGLGEDILS